MQVAYTIAQRSTCTRRKVGAVLVKDGRIIATGYNGSLPKAPHCTEQGCLLVNGHCKRTIHAELNAILQCAKFGISAQGAECYVTTAPCAECLKALVSVGVTAVYAADDNPYEPEYSIDALYASS